MATICTKHLDDPSASVRHAAAEALGDSLVVALGQPYNNDGDPAGKGGKASKPPPKPKTGGLKMFEGASPALSRS